MSKIVSFTRVNSNNSDYEVAQLEGVKSYIKSSGLSLNQNIKVDISAPSMEDDMKQVITDLEEGITLVVYSLHNLGRTVENILEAINTILEKSIRLVVVEQQLDLVSSDAVSHIVVNVIKMTLELEKSLMSIRTRESLIAKKIDGVSLGKPKGTIQKSKFDEQREKIEELLKVGLSVRKIAKLLGYSNHIGLNNYIKKRNIREKIETASSLGLAV
jgi:putative DNA-invertase from lambdoid prophage Rac